MTAAAEKAETLLADLLKDGPRSAGDVLTAAANAGISERSIQRASIAAGVVKIRAGFKGGWTWRLPADQEENAEAPSICAPLPPATAAPVMLKEPKVSPVSGQDRAEAIAARLRKLEAGRGRIAPIYALDPRVKRWADSGISDPDLREAYERAVFDLERDKKQGPVTAGILDPYV